MIDWSRLIMNLRGAGLSTYAIARRAKCSPSNVSMLACAHTREPGPELTVRLIDLHFDACPEQHNPAVIGTLPGWLEELAA